MPAYLETLTAKFPGSFATSEFRDNRRVVVPADRTAVLFDLMRCLKDE